MPMSYRRRSRKPGILLCKGFNQVKTKTRACHDTSKSFLRHLGSTFEHRVNARVVNRYLGAVCPGVTFTLSTSSGLLVLFVVLGTLQCSCVVLTAAALSHAEVGYPSYVYIAFRNAVTKILRHNAKVVFRAMANNFLTWAHSWKSCTAH